MKITKFISLTFAAKPTATAYVNVPFRVKTMHIKSFAYKAGTNGTTNYVALLSNMGNQVNTPLAIMNQDTTYSSGTISDIEIKLLNPEPIQGYYNFNIVDMDETDAATSNSGAATDYVGLVIEFNDENEML
jgi:hypothetical protein